MSEYLYYGPLDPVITFSQLSSAKTFLKNVCSLSVFISANAPAPKIWIWSLVLPKCPYFHWYRLAPSPGVSGSLFLWTAKGPLPEWVGACLHLSTSITLPPVPLSFSTNPPDSQVRAMPEHTIDAYHWFSKLSVNRKPTQERVFCCIFTFKLVFQGYIVGISQYPIPTIISWGTST